MGSIVSNMAFTNHLNYAYRHDVSQLEPYLLKMKEILAALAPGGSFYYARPCRLSKTAWLPSATKWSAEQPPASFLSASSPAFKPVSYFSRKGIPMNVQIRPYTVTTTMP